MSNPVVNGDDTIQVGGTPKDSLEKSLDINMGKTTDGDVDNVENRGQTDNKNADHKSSTEQEKMDSPKTETKIVDNEDQQDDVNSEDGANGEVDEPDEAQEEAAKTMSVEIKDKSPKQPDDINHFDSVSNIKSQPDKGREHKKDVRISNMQKNEKTDSVVVSQTNSNHQTPRLKKMKKGIFISYSPDAGFLERRFVVEAVRQLKENNLADDIWFDKDEKNTDSPCWFSMRMEAVEKCRAAVLVLSDSYFTCPVSLYEGKTLVERSVSDPSSVKIFPVLFRQPDPVDVPKHFSVFLDSAIDLTGEHVKKSAAEKTSVVVGNIMEELEKYATMHTAPLPVTPPDSEFTGEFRKKKICQWSASDLQEWLFNLGIKEFYRQSLAEAMVDGFLLMSLTDHDMVTHLGIESRVVRKKIMQQILQTLDREHKHPDNWHLRSRALRPKPDVVYIIYDPADVRLAQNLKVDLKAKNLQVRLYFKRS
ncbi:Bf-tir-sam-like protein [Plakobranchus ocellatus]|uniref:Bf-tir-sam-like protein n=1 Tax=Plakobranchus ocellatus TaxID=259542 RepID=A0AAV4B6M7_9GAST|nr:Bf-tir-sam-like protein [Plakobranchus ocellatus]